MLPVDLFRRPVFALSVATAICAHAAQLIAFVALPFYFQYVSGLSPIQIGVLITPWPAALVVMAPIAGRLADRHSAGLLGGFGLAVMTLGLLLVLFLPARPARLDVAWRLAVCGVGFGFFQSPNNRADDCQRAARPRAAPAAACCQRRACSARPRAARWSRWCSA